VGPPGATGFAVIDLETTGFSVQDDHRNIEIAIVHLDPTGRAGSRERVPSDRPYRDKYSVLGRRRVRGHQGGERDTARRVAEVVAQDIHLAEDGGITYRTNLRVSFKYEPGE
jgi:hypothetical protein